MVQLLQYVSSQNFYYAKYHSRNEMCLQDSPFSKHYKSFNWKLHYTNPVVSSNTPDPGVLMLPDGLGYTVVSTSNFAVNSTEGAFKILHSKDLVNWSFVSCTIQHRLFLFFKKPRKYSAVTRATKLVKSNPKEANNEFHFFIYCRWDMHFPVDNGLLGRTRTCGHQSCTLLTVATGCISQAGGGRTIAFASELHFHPRSTMAMTWPF